MVTDCSWLPVTLIWIYWFVCLFVFFFFFFYYSQFVAWKIVVKVVFFYVVIGHKIFGLFYLSLFCYGIIIYYGGVGKGIQGNLMYQIRCELIFLLLWNSQPPIPTNIGIQLNCINLYVNFIFTFTKTTKNRNHQHKFELGLLYKYIYIKPKIL